MHETMIEFAVEGYLKVFHISLCRDDARCIAISGGFRVVSVVSIETPWPFAPTIAGQSR